MDISGALNNYRGSQAEAVVADNCNGKLAMHAGYDVETEDLLIEVKSCLSHHISTRSDKKYLKRGRILVNTESHEILREIAKNKNKKAIYAFVIIPRNDNGDIENDSSKWIEAWFKWEDIDSILKNPETSGVDGMLREHIIVLTLDTFLAYQFRDIISNQNTFSGTPSLRSNICHFL